MTDRDLIAVLFTVLAFAAVVPYLICSINPAIVVTRLKSGKDIRELGSGNPGLTNVLRTQGKGAAGVVLLLDALKGVVSILAIMLFILLFGGGDFEPVSVALWLGAFAGVLGHCYPVWHKFRGGKAVLVTVATGFVINWQGALIALILFIIIVAITRYVSLGSCIAAGLYPGIVFIIDISRHGVVIGEFHNVIGGVMFTPLIAAVLIFKHRANIKRLLAGSEKKLGKKEKQEEKPEVQEEKA
ncbi:MAG: glycerol-3-phosphate 1-O-acyltransferase PlsY [Oscillospiraceae bacterium]|nr:glycerol-3-phosphate 1-O-acyltransferase PlsY [Oscillospiraceae bacterium]